MRKRKVLLEILLLTLGSSCIPIHTSANILSDQQATAEFSQSNAVLYSSDIIEYRYRYLSNGQLQYRRWNDTKKKWVDPYWINLN